jgi:small GTP-binding protein
LTKNGDDTLIQKKICLLGASSVGKTSLVKQFVEGIFNEKYLTTIGVKIDKKVITIEKDEIQLMLWDIEGTDRYNAFQERYLRGAAGYIIVVDQTRASSLLEGIDIHNLARQVTDCPAILAINKNDLAATWHWSDSDNKTYHSLFNLQISTSAKTGKHVEQMFAEMGKLVLRSEKNDVTT